jgi:hypothetical protein
VYSHHQNDGEKWSVSVGFLHESRGPGCEVVPIELSGRTGSMFS